MNRIRLRAGLVGLAAAVTGLTCWATGQSPSLPIHPASGVTPTSLLVQPIADITPNAAQLRRGRSLAIDGDCMACHLRPGGQPFAGGLGLKTPFGVIYSPNITSDRETGIGGWTSDQFYRAMHNGIGAHGENLYPAFPYPWFSRASRADDDAILAYLKTTPAVSYRPPANRLPFPFNIRFMVKGWNQLFFRPHEFQADPVQSPEWNHGAYLVEGLGHCGGCHTPINFLGASKTSRSLQGGQIDNWVAPDLTANARTGVGGWSVADLTEYLGTGRNVHAGAGGPMGEVVSDSTSLMTDQDRHAIALYLMSKSASPDAASRPADPGAMRRGAAIYSDACASCHLESGVGQPQFFPPLGHNAVVQQADPTGVEHLILAGSRVGPTAARPSPLTMPSFAWKLTDSEIADVSTYIRNSWGNRAAPVSPSKVRDMRHRLGLRTIHYTVNSGDQG